MAGRQIFAGYYRRYDDKVAYVISLDTNADTGEEMVIWTTYQSTAPPAKSLLRFRESER